MTKQTINIGTVPNDGTGDTLRDAFDKTNDNFDEIYAGFSFTNTNVKVANVNVTNVNVIKTQGKGGNLKTPLWNKKKQIYKKKATYRKREDGTNLINVEL